MRLDLPLVFLHLAFQLLHDQVDRGIEILTALFPADRQIPHPEGHLGDLTILLHGENDMGRRDPFEVPLQPPHLLFRISPQGLGDLQIASGEKDLHG